jgi:heat-inducible transcriptional repressor
MPELTDRQIRILKLIIEEYIETAFPVGSNILEKKYELGISPATIRNEMVKLAQMGYLSQPHTSAGRAPTKTAFKFYVDRLMEEKKLSVADEVSAKEQVWDSRFDFEKLLQDATRALAQKTGTIAISATKDGHVYHAGYANILDMPEFFEINLTKALLTMLEESTSVFDLFNKNLGEDALHLLLGDELGVDFLEPCSMVFTEFGQEGSDKCGFLGVIGPVRLNYAYIVPMVKYFRNLIEEVGKE